MTNPAAPAEAEIRRLLDIMAALRNPDTGCPWDKTQTFDTIAPYTIEEAYEVADAIAQRDFAVLPDELGDLLFQVVYHARMAEEAGQFTFADVARRISDKMVRRHPHVFRAAPEENVPAAAPRTASANAVPQGRSVNAAPQGPSANAVPQGPSVNAASRDAAAQTAAWESQKSAERAARQQSGALSGVAIGLPALTRALKLSSRAARVGFDWPDPEQVLAKLDEEVRELRAELPNADPVRLTDEVGDLLFVLANLARKLDLDPEACLRHANDKFSRRFNAMERDVEFSAKSLQELTLAEMEDAWQRIKAMEHR